MNPIPSVAFIGGGNMANALVSGLLGQGCPASQLHVLEVAEVLREQWRARGISVASAPDASLSTQHVWIFAVKPQQMREVVLQCKPWLKPDTLIMSIAAGISLKSLSSWLGTPTQPFTRVVRCMPNTPALVRAGVTGMAAIEGLAKSEKDIATDLLGAVGQVVWVENDQAIDAVTALSGSGPAYVFLFLESLMAGAQALGLSAEQSRRLALATLAGSTQLAAESTEPPGVLRERVTSKGGTTAAALDVFAEQHFSTIVAQAMAAANDRAAELSKEFGR
jgi:pyrroline-5-carboxylate reductase